MGELRITIPEWVLREFPDVAWPEIAERAVLVEFRRLVTIKLFDELFKHSELTDEACLSLGKEVSRAVRLRIEQELQARYVSATSETGWLYCKGREAEGA